MESSQEPIRFSSPRIDFIFDLLFDQRVDVLQSSRHVRVELNGVELANTHKPRLLFETGLGVRTYIPITDCRLDLLEHSELTTDCSYKVNLFTSVRRLSLTKVWRRVRRIIIMSVFQVERLRRILCGGTA